MSTDAPKAVFRWNSASLSDVGAVREVNEDACVEVPESGLWLVADGMGGHEGGAFASRAVVELVADIKPAPRLRLMVDELSMRLQQANRLLREEAARRGGGLMGTTVAALLLHGRHSVCVWVGDSRVYRIRDGVLRQLTRDHRWVEEYVARGLMSREAADRHPMAHEITRAIGAEDSLELSIEVRELAAADRFLLCSDGLHGEMSDQDIARLLQQDGLHQACHAMVDHAKQNGAHDNVTVIAVQVESA